MTFLPSLLLPDGMTDLVFCLLIALSFAGSLISVSFGLGGGAMLLAVMATLVPPAALIPTHGVIQLGSNLARASLLFRNIHRPALPAFALGSVLGVTLGGSVAVNLPPAWVQIGVGGFIAWSVLGRPPRGVRDWPFLVGLVSSILTMFFGATGPFVATYVKALALPRHAVVATQAALMCVQHVVKTIVFGLLGFAFADWWAFIAAMILAGFLGTLTGRRVLNRIDDRRFRRVLNAILLLLAARLVYAGLRALLG
ncbi:sulfite exporter TauE/SafE family protein [Seohaeicola nanhaiensis]|uniref:Probable membrane transporter protein n=1 Tax=Seohaeicola nanhaiensis TaxID=1387282 RepID=A0ABV9KP96_9RHOB